MVDELADADDVFSDGTPARRYRRRSEELEFDRVAFFSDAVFAIAMTLLVVGIGIPKVKAGGDLGEALSSKDAEIFSFFLSFVVIGFFWLAHHRFFARLAAVDQRFMQINLLYLATIAFTPFPTAIVGVYGGDEPVGVAYAVTLGVASFLEAALLWRAQHQGLLRQRMRDDVFRGNMTASLAPVAVFAISIPIAFLVTSGALLSWLLIFPLEWFIGRYVIPKDADPF